MLPAMPSAAVHRRVLAVGPVALALAAVVPAGVGRAGEAGLAVPTPVRAPRSVALGGDPIAVQLAAADARRSQASDRPSRGSTRLRALAPAPAPAARPRLSVVVAPVLGRYRLTAGYDESGGLWTKRHTGQDFACSWGTPVRAVAAGRVVFAATKGAYGRRVSVRHADGTYTTYNHLSHIAVEVGDRLTAGQVLGRVGSSGNTTGAHLHLEVLPDGVTFTDPRAWLLDHGVRI